VLPSNDSLTSAEIDLFAAGSSAVLHGPNGEEPTEWTDINCGDAVDREAAKAMGNAIVTYLRTNGPTLRMRIAFLKTLNYGSMRALFFAVNHPDDELFGLMAHKIADIVRRAV
jgi:hypothetical protein